MFPGCPGLFLPRQSQTVRVREMMGISGLQRVLARDDVQSQGTTSRIQNARGHWHRKDRLGSEDPTR